MSNKKNSKYNMIIKITKPEIKDGLAYYKICVTDLDANNKT